MYFTFPTTRVPCSITPILQMKWRLRIIKKYAEVSQLVSGNSAVVYLLKGEE